MFGLPKDFNASVFVGQELIQICFTANTIHLTFDREVTITLLSSFVEKHGLNEMSRRETVPVLSSGLMRLIGQKVSSASSESDGTLTLEFEDGNTLICLDDSPSYESYSIRVGDKEIIV